MKPRFFKTQRDFEKWLAANHRTADAVDVGLYKVGSRKRGISYREALEVALAYGWIDGVTHRVDAHAWTIRFSPRRKGSHWSAINTRRAKALIKAGRMKAAGLAAFQARDEGKTRRLSYALKTAALDAAALRALRADKKAFASFQALPPGMKRLYAYWIVSAKREETRAKRMAIMLERLRAGKRLDPMHPFMRD